MGERDIGEAERPELEAALALDLDQFDLLEDPLFLQLAADQAGSERRGVERHAEIGGEIGDRPDMILMPVGEDDTEQIVALAFDEIQIGQDQLDAGVGRVGKGQAEIDHHPFALRAIEIDVHANLPRAAEGKEKKFVSRRCH